MSIIHVHAGHFPIRAHLILNGAHPVFGYLDIFIIVALDDKVACVSKQLVHNPMGA